MTEIEKEAAKLYERVMSRYYSMSEKNRRPLWDMVEEELSRYNKKVRPIIEKMIEKELGAAFRGEPLPEVVPTPPELSDMLHRNAKQAAGYAAALLYQGWKANEPLHELSKRLYDGYGFRDKEVLDLRKKMPEYLRRQIAKESVQRSITKQVERLKTKPLKSAYREVLKAVEEQNEIALARASKVAIEEKARYYATRIADTETNRARNLARAKQYIEDDEIELVRYRMSSRHPMVDICDYYANLDVGYGRGVVPKTEMVSLPLHPHCHCRYDPYYRKVKLRSVSDPERQAMDQFTPDQQRRILGGWAHWKKWKEGGGSVVDVVNSLRPGWPTTLAVSALSRRLPDRYVESIRVWSEDSSEIKRVMWGISDDKEAKAHARRILELFDRSELKIAAGIKLYRGMGMSDEIYESFGYDKCKPGDIYTPDESAVASFSYSKRVAYNYSADSPHKKKVVLIVTSDEDNFVDISSTSSKPEEIEVLHRPGVWYNIRRTKKVKRGAEEWLIMILEKKDQE